MPRLTRSWPRSSGRGLSSLQFFSGGRASATRASTVSRPCRVRRGRVQGDLLHAQPMPARPSADPPWPAAGVAEVLDVAARTRPPLAPACGGLLPARSRDGVPLARVHHGARTAAVRRAALPGRAAWRWRSRRMTVAAPPGVVAGSRSLSRWPSRSSRATGRPSRRRKTLTRPLVTYTPPLLFTISLARQICTSQKRTPRYLVLNLGPERII